MPEIPKSPEQTEIEFLATNSPQTPEEWAIYRAGIQDEIENGYPTWQNDGSAIPRYVRIENGAETGFLDYSQKTNGWGVYGIGVHGEVYVVPGGENVSLGYAVQLAVVSL